MAVFMSSVIWSFKLIVFSCKKTMARAGVPGRANRCLTADESAGDQYIFLGNCMLRTRL